MFRGPGKFPFAHPLSHKLLFRPQQEQQEICVTEPPLPYFRCDSRMHPSSTF